MAPGRALAYDDAGDPAGRPVVYLHGCPDCRLTRPQKDDEVGAGGIRLIAVDRPGYGASDADPDGSVRSLGDDVAALVTALDIERYAVVGWSSGAPAALACAVADPDRVAAVGVAAGQVPIDADDDPRVRAALGPAFAARREIAATMTPVEFAANVAPLVAPSGMTVDIADELIVEHKPDSYLDELASVPGLRERLANAMVVAVASGNDGVRLDLRLMVLPWDFDLASVLRPVRLWYGTDDSVFGPACGEWLAARLPDARLEIVDGASHLLPMVRWTELLTELVSVGWER